MDPLSKPAFLRDAAVSAHTVRSALNARPPPSAAASAAAIAAATTPAASLASISSAAVGTPYVPPADLVAAYERVFKAQAYDSMDGLAAQHVIATGKSYYDKSGGAPRYARHAAPAAGASGGRRMMRIAAELASLADLAVSWASSIVVRSDAGSTDVLRAVVSGPPGTPYENGLLVFDVLLPEDYPASPPKMVLLTTGGGRVRFNPNLYAGGEGRGGCRSVIACLHLACPGPADGKVCLSLLGTWAGPGWDPAVSTLSQLFLAVQAQILVDLPLVNEPGFEQLQVRGCDPFHPRACHCARCPHTPSQRTAGGMRGLQLYNARLRLATLRHGILEPMRRPPQGFEKITQAHFALKRDELRAQAARWASEVRAVAAYEAGLVLQLRTMREAVQAAKQAEAVLRAQLGRWRRDHAEVDGYPVFHGR